MWPGALKYRCPLLASYCREGAITACLCLRKELLRGMALCPFHTVGWSDGRDSPLRAAVADQNRKSRAWNRAIGDLSSWGHHNGFRKQLTKCKISLQYTQPLFAKWCEVGCVNDSTLTSSPFRSLIMPWWCCSHCCRESQHFHYNFLFSGVFTVVIKIQSRLKLGILGLLPGVISFCCIWKRKPFICFYITRAQQKEAKAGFGEYFYILYCLLFLSCRRY